MLSDSMILFSKAFKNIFFASKILDTWLEGFQKIRGLIFVLKKFFRWNSLFKSFMKSNSSNSNFSSIMRYSLSFSNSIDRFFVCFFRALILWAWLCQILQEKLQKKLLVRANLFPEVRIFTLLSIYLRLLSILFANLFFSFVQSW